MDFENLNLIFGVIICSAGLLMFIFSLVQLLKAHKSCTWPTTQGIIIEVGIDQSSGRDRKLNFRPVVIFEYQVSGKKYTNDRISYSSKLYTNSAKRAAKIVSAYKKAQQVTVYYPFQNPSEGILETGINREQITGILLSLVFLIFGAFLLITQV